LGLGEAFGNFLMMALLALVAVIAIRFLMNRFRQNNGGAAARGAGPQLAGAGAPWSPQGNQARAADNLSPMQREAQQAFSPAAPVGASAGSAVSAVPAGFDAAGFERIAK